MKIEFKLDGLPQLNHKIERTKWDIIGATKKAIFEEAQEIMTESKKQVPQMTGTLLESAYIEQDAHGDVEFGYGGPNAPTNPLTQQSVNDYMVAVHERLDVVHPQGKAKFLEDPINSHKSRMEDSLIGKIKKFFTF